jgi:hypothetical protein
VYCLTAAWIAVLPFMTSRGLALALRLQPKLHELADCIRELIDGSDASHESPSTRSQQVRIAADRVCFHR